jgi:acetoin utilization deacetylase AcuC-like enzyme
VSAGYDAHWRDPLAGLQMRTATYHHLAAQLQALADRLCGGRLVLLLEGGYDLRVRREGV